MFPILMLITIYIMTRIKSFLKKIPGIQSLWNRLSEYRLQKQTVESRFTTIFANNSWGDQASLSGTGSNLAETETIRQAITEVLKNYNVKTFLDIPCGDFYWMKELDLSAVNYIGADIVKPLIAQNKERYSQNNRVFCHLNLLTDVLPKVDLVFCRDCLVHLSSADIRLALKNLVRSGSTYLLTTTFPDHSVNIDIITGRWRPLNLEIAPFNFPKPIIVINEQCREGEEFKDKSLALWELKSLAPLAD